MTRSLMRPARRRSDPSGQALVEFALVFPIVVLMLAAILQFGLIFSSQIGLTNSVREAARYGSVLSVISDTDAAANGAQVLAYLVGSGGVCGPSGLLSTNVHPFVCAATDSDPGLGPNSASVSHCKYQNVTGSGTYSVRISVRVSYNHPLYLPIVANIIDAMDGGTPGSFRLTANEQMRVENRPDLSAADVGGLSQTCA